MWKFSSGKVDHQGPKEDTQATNKINAITSIIHYKLYYTKHIYKPKEDTQAKNKINAITSIIHYKSYYTKHIYLVNMSQSIHLSLHLKKKGGYPRN
jgi:hypothetical protein